MHAEIHRVRDDRIEGVPGFGRETDEREFGDELRSRAAHDESRRSRHRGHRARVVTRRELEAMLAPGREIERRSHDEPAMADVEDARAEVHRDHVAVELADELYARKPPPSGRQQVIGWDARRHRRQYRHATCQLRPRVAPQSVRHFARVCAAPTHGSGETITFR